MDLVKIRRELHKIPELGFKEIKTQTLLLEVLASFHSERLVIEKWHTGLLVKIKGLRPEKTIAYRADIDGLPIEEKTGYDFKSEHPGKMHACGHDFHMTIALGVIEQLINQPGRDDVLVIFQPAEEGPGGALPLMEAESFKTHQVDEIFSLHVAPELPVGTVASRPGLLFANTSELFIDFKGKGGHAAYPHLTHDMAVASSYFVTELQQIVARRINPIESAVVTIGKMTAGTVQNSIAETARLEGTIRTSAASSIALIKENIEAFAAGFSEAHHCEIPIDYGSNYYQVFNHKSYVERFAKWTEQLGIIYKEADPAMTGEDFGYFLKEIPGFMFWLGVDSPFGLHNGQLQPDENALQVGVDVVTHTLRQLMID